MIKSFILVYFWQSMILSPTYKDHYKINLKLAVPVYDESIRARYGWCCR